VTVVLMSFVMRGSNQLEGFAGGKFRRSKSTSLSVKDILSEDNRLS
jgi:hypothetical protein